MGKIYRDSKGKMTCRHAGENDGHGMDDYHLEQFEARQWDLRSSGWAEREKDCLCPRCECIRKKVERWKSEQRDYYAPRVWKTADEIHRGHRQKESERRDLEWWKVRTAYEVRKKEYDERADAEAKRNAQQVRYPYGPYY